MTGWLPVTLVLCLAVQAADAQGAGSVEQMSPGHTAAAENRFIEPPKPIDGFTLTDHTGGTLSDETLVGHWDMVYFGYTFCPDVCPVALSTLAGVIEELEGSGWANDSWTAWLVSVDPERDTPARLGEYVRHFHPAFNGATGERRQIDHLATQMQVRYEIEDHKPGDRFYVVSHTSTVGIIDPDGALVAVLEDSAHPADFANRMNTLRDAYRARQTKDPTQ